MRWSDARVLSTKSCLTLCDPMGCSPPGSCVHGIFQTRILECVAISWWSEDLTANLHSQPSPNCPRGHSQKGRLNEGGGRETRIGQVTRGAGDQRGLDRNYNNSSWKTQAERDTNSEQLHRCRRRHSLSLSILWDRNTPAQRMGTTGKK